MNHLTSKHTGEHKENHLPNKSDERELSDEGLSVAQECRRQQQILTFILESRVIIHSMSSRWRGVNKHPKGNGIALCRRRTLAVSVVNGSASASTCYTNLQQIPFLDTSMF